MNKRFKLKCDYLLNPRIHPIVNTKSQEGILFEKGHIFYHIDSIEGTWFYDPVSKKYFWIFFSHMNALNKENKEWLGFNFEEAAINYNKYWAKLNE